MVQPELADPKADPFSSLGMTEEALLESDTKYRLLFENIPETVVLRRVIYDQHGEIIDLELIDANPAHLHLLGARSIDEVKSRRYTELYNPEMARWTLDHVRRVLASGKPLTEESQSDVNDRYYLTTSVSLGKDLIFTTDVDITERKKVEEVLRESNEYLERLINFANAPIVVWNSECIITRFNHAFEVLTDIPANEAVGSSLSMLFPESSKAASMELIRHAMEGKQWDVVEIPIQHRSGQVRTVVWNSANIMGSDAQLRGTIAQGQDITARKWAENALKESEAKYRGLFENIQETVVLFRAIYNQHGEIIDLELTDANPAHLHLLGARSIEELKGKRYSEIYDPEMAIEMLDQVRKVIVIGTSISTETHLDSNNRDYIITITPLGKEYIMSTGVDITERQIREDEVNRSNAELQLFAYVASHDLQEPLRMVVSYLNLLERKYLDKLDPQGQEYIHYAIDGGMRMRELIDDLLAYSKIEIKSKDFAPVDMNEVVAETMKVLKAPIDEVQAEIMVQPLPTVLADGTQMLQLMQNILGNAIKFRSTARPRVEVSAKENGVLHTIAIKDNGIGIDMKYQDKVFQMFQRLHTRDKYKGTGIGMAISKKIVERHGGRIWFESDGKNGTTFFFTIPKVYGRG